MSDDRTLSQIAEVLLAVENVSEDRTQPQPGDLEGDFDRWFDGGAVKIVTGSTDFTFANGSRAARWVTPGLNLLVGLPDGREFALREQ